MDVQGQISEAEKALKVLERNLREIDREKRSLELRVMTLSEDLKKAEAKRRDVRNTKEEFSAGKEFDAFQKKLVDTKRALTEKTELSTQISQGRDEKQKAFEALQTKFAELDTQRKARLAEIAKQRSGLLAQRDEYISMVDDTVFSLYERVQKIRKGNGVALVEGLVCGGCHVSIPPHTKIRLEKMEEIITCSSCSRILFPASELDSNFRAQAAS